MSNNVAPNATRPVPKLAPGIRLVPAAIGLRGAAQIIWIQCPDWCVDDHVAERQIAVEDVSHHGAVDCVQVPTMGDDLYSAFELYSQLYSDPISADPRMRTATVLVTDGSRDAYLTPSMAEELADDLIKKAAQIRQKARIARRANASVVDSDPNMDEALRQVRGGVA